MKSSDGNDFEDITTALPERGPKTKNNSHFLPCLDPNFQNFILPHHINSCQYSKLSK